jgi:hypothetical protein
MTTTMMRICDDEEDLVVIKKMMMMMMMHDLLGLSLSSHKESSMVAMLSSRTKTLSQLCHSFIRIHLIRHFPIFRHGHFFMSDRFTFESLKLQFEKFARAR